MDAEAATLPLFQGQGYIRSGTEGGIKRRSVIDDRDDQLCVAFGQCNVYGMAFVQFAVFDDIGDMLVKDQIDLGNDPPRQQPFILHAAEMGREDVEFGQVSHDFKRDVHRL